MRTDWPIEDPQRANRADRLLEGQSLEHPVGVEAWSTEVTVNVQVARRLGADLRALEQLGGRLE